MPITQDRILEVIRAGQAWKRAFNEIGDQITQILQWLESGDYTEAEARGYLALLPQQHAPKLEDIISLDVEARYYESNAKRNASAKRRAAGKREMIAEACGVPIKHKIPRIGLGPSHSSSSDILSADDMERILSGRVNLKDSSE